jgi:hypothetical protein
MPATTTPPRPRDVDVIRIALGFLTARLPDSWTGTVREGVAANGKRADAVIDLTAPDGASAAVVVEGRTSLQTGAAPSAARQAASLAESLRTGGAAAAPLVVARYLSPPARAALVDAGVGYADATGNLRLQIDRPALFIRDAGADRDPWRGPGRPRGTLRGVTAVRLVRALADFAPPYSVPGLARRSGASVGATYRMVEFLQQEGLLTREPRSPVAAVDWRGILQQRGAEVGTGEAEGMTLYLEPRGIPELLTKLRASRQPYVLTGSLAARYYDEVVPARLAMLYADPVGPLVTELGLRESPSGNVLAGVPIDPVVFERSHTVAGLRVAAASQVVLDLLGGPGRGPSEAEMLLDWMERNPDAWRR